MKQVTRKRYEAEFKPWVAVEAIRGELTSKHGVYQTMTAEVGNGGRSRVWRLPIVRQCTLLRLNRSGASYRPVPQSEANLAPMRLIDE